MLYHKMKSIVNKNAQLPMARQQRLSFCLLLIVKSQQMLQQTKADHFFFQLKSYQEISIGEKIETLCFL